MRISALVPTLLVLATFVPQASRAEPSDVVVFDLPAGARPHDVAPAPDGTAGIGSRVRVRHGDSGEVAEYELVGPIESDVGNGRVSVGAPVGRALVGRCRGATVAVETPRGTMQLEILSVGPASRLTAKEAA